jgi:hypothetical protein
LQTLDKLASLVGYKYLEIFPFIFDPLIYNIRSNSNLITQEYSRLNGATEVLPGSHLWNKKPNQFLC